MREIDIGDYAGLTFVTQPGTPPQVQWIDVAALRVDDRYQRPIGQRGKVQIRRIAERFRWSRFAPIIVAPAEGGVYAIIDGQHRAHAARLRGVKSVPAMIVPVDTAEQAEAFVEINTRQLAVNPATLHRSRVASGDIKALALQALCDRVGVRIVTPRHQNELKRGDSFAAVKLYKLQDLYGDEVLGAALRAIVAPGEGNVGLVRTAVLDAYCAAFEACPPPASPSGPARRARRFRPRRRLRAHAGRGGGEGRPALAGAGRRAFLLPEARAAR